MNIRAIAKLARVSVASVSRTLSGKDPAKVSPSTRARILKICEEMRYSPNVHMLRISRKRANTVSFLFPPNCHYDERKADVRMDDNLSAALIGAQEELDRHGTSLLLTSVSERFLAGKEYIKLHRSKTVDGLLIWGWTGPAAYLDEMRAEGIPVVMLQGRPAGRRFNAVETADAAGMRMLVEHVVRCGHRRIGIVTASQSASAGRERLGGARRALRAHGFSPSWESEVSGFSVAVGYEACREILMRAPDTTCVIGSNDLTALGAIRAAREMGRAVPEELSVTGADGLELYGQVNLTTYAAQSYEVGRQAARLLGKVVDAPDRAPRLIRVPVRFIPGNTVGAPATARMADDDSKSRRKKMAAPTGV